MATSVRVVGPDIAKLNKQLKTLGKTANRELVNELRKAAEPAAADVRRAVLALPSKGRTGAADAKRGRHYIDRHSGKSTAGRARAARKVQQSGTGLRASIARATKVTVRPSAGVVAITVDSKEMPRGQQSLPEYLDGAKRPWRHPVFQTKANPDTWVVQASRPFFTAPIRRHRAQFNTAAEKALRAAARKAGFR